MNDAVKNNAFGGLGDILDKGFGDLMADGDTFSHVELDDIEVIEQVREEFDDQDNTQADMNESIKKHGVIQPVLLRPTPKGPKPYQLVAGERRLRGSRANELKTIPALIREMTDEEAETLQFQENIQRKNLTQIEEAKRIQKDLNELGSVEAVLAKHLKSRAWLSKILSLLSLPEQAKRLLTEKISADLEVINTVKTIEKIDPVKAEQVVNDLKDAAGKAKQGNAREIANAAKEEVKPSKKKNAANATPDNKKTDDQNKPVDGIKTEPNNTTSPDEAKAGAGKESAQAGALPPRAELTEAFNRLVNKKHKPEKVLAGLEAHVVEWIRQFYIAGANSFNPAATVIANLRNDTFSTSNEGAFALVAYVQGSDTEIKEFDILNILASVAA